MDPEVLLERIVTRIEERLKAIDAGEIDSPEDFVNDVRLLVAQIRRMGERL